MVMRELVWITPGTTKMGWIPSVSMDPEVACPDSIPCRRACYAMRLCGRRPTVKRRWRDNFEVAEEYPDVYFREIRKWLEENRPANFRWHVGGEILGPGYFMKMRDTARMFPETEFLCFTKMYSMAEEGWKLIPGNLTVILSVWPGMVIPSGEHFARAWLDKDPRKPVTANVCKGHCEECMMCFGMKHGNIVLHWR